MSELIKEIILVAVGSTGAFWKFIACSSDRKTVHIFILGADGQNQPQNVGPAKEEQEEPKNAEGYKVTQATVSRDIRDLRLTKVQTENGKQKYAALKTTQSELAEKYFRILKDGFVSMGMAQNILVIKTVSGMAMAVAVLYRISVCIGFT